MRKLLAAVAAAAGALVVAACGGGGHESAPPPATGAQEAAGVLVSAASDTANAGSSKVAFTFTTQLPPEVQQEPVTFTGEGAFDYVNRKGKVTYDFGELFSSLGLPAGDDPVEAIFDGAVMYMKFPLLSAFLPDAKPWLKLDPATLGAQAGLDLSQLQQLGQSDPAQLLDYLRATSETVEEVGSEEIGGVDTTHYRGTVQLESVADQVPPDQQEQVRAAIEKLIEQTGTTEIPVDVWVDGDGLVRKAELTYTAKIQVPGSEPQETESVVTMEFSDFGTAVEVEPPPADQVTDLAELALTGSS